MNGLEKKIQVAFGVALVFLLFTGVAAWWSTHRNQQAFLTVSHTYEVLDTVEELLVAVLNVETGVRGYAITGDPPFLSSYEAGSKSIHQLANRARQLTSDNPNQQRRLATFDNVMRTKEKQMDELILQQRGNPDTLHKFDLLRKGQQLTGQIQQLIAEMEREEEALLRTRTVKAENMSRLTLSIVTFAGSITFLFLGFAMVTLRRDFRKRQQAEEERDRFFTLPLDMLVIAGQDGRFKRINPAFTQTLGWSEEELLARPYLDFVHPDDRTTTLQQVEKLAIGESITHFENRYRCKDGSWRVLSWKSVPHSDGMVYAAARDMTERKQIEEALRRSEEKLAVTLNSIGDAVLATDANGKITRVNGVTERLTGWSFAAAQGRPIAEVFRIIRSETREPATIPVNEVLATGQVCGLAHDTILIARDGTERAIADSAAPIRDHEGEIIGVVMVFRDVTDERKKDEALRESEQRLRLLNEELEQRVKERTAEVQRALTTLDATEDGALIFDPDTFRFSYANEGAVRQLGYSREELLQMTVLDIKPEFTGERYHEILAPIIQGEIQSRRFTTIHRRKDGRDIPVEISLQYIAPPGERPRCVSIARDISERLKHERMALRSQRLEAIGTLAGGVAHDLNNALAPIMMGIEIVRMQYPKASEIVDMFQNSAKRSADMVRQLLTFAKGAEGERVSIQLTHLFKEMESIIRGTFPKNLQLQTKLEKNLAPVVGDATQLHQVLLNLCVNARDAMPGGGTLTIEARSVKVDDVYASAIPDAKPGEYIALSVRDTGTGIPTAILDRIFDPFFTTKGPDRGTGLGLSTVMGIIKGHGGFLQVTSHVGQGSTFTSFLPIDRTGRDISSSKEVAFRGNGETILFVDDEAAIRNIARNVLQRFDLKSVTAGDGAEGLMQLAEHRAEITAVITDLHMPYMDGVAFVRAIRRMLPDIPVVVASGRLDDKEKEEFKALRVNAYLDKPFTETELAGVLAKILQRP